MEKQEKDLAYWKANAEEDYMKVPISVLRSISELEQALSQHNVSGCGHPFDEIELSEDGLFCYKCCRWVRPDAHIH